MRPLRFAALAAIALAAGAAPAPALGQALVGSYSVDAGPSWVTSPPTYTCQEACALIFGGEALGYDCSTNGTTIDNQAYVAGWGTGQYCDTPVAEDFKVADQVTDCGSVGCYYSAYVSDWCEAEDVNYCWLPTCGNGFLNPNEECDDGNNVDGDCCSAACQAEPAEQSCGNGDTCDGAELCDGAGACLAGTPLDCADSDPCTQDQCDATLGCQNPSEPAPVCDDEAAKASLALDATKDKASFSWQKGTVSLLDWGTPDVDTDYTLCVYDADGPVVQLSAPGGAPWKATGKVGSETGFVYKDKNGANDGLRAIALKAHEAGKAKASLQAKGEGTPAPALGDGLTAPIAAQLVSSEGGCWGATFALDDLKKNDAETLKASHKNAPE